MKIFCIDWNDIDTNNSNRQGVDSHPIVYLKPDTALLKDNKPFYFPDFSSHIEYTVHLVVSIHKIGKCIDEAFAKRYYNEVALGVDFRAKDIFEQLQDRRYPWDISTSFDSSAVLSHFVPINSLNDFDNIEFALFKNKKEVQRGSTIGLRLRIDKLIAYLSQFYSLKIGDLIYTGTPSGRGEIAIGDRLQGYIGHQEMFDFEVK